MKEKPHPQGKCFSVWPVKLQPASHLFKDLTNFRLWLGSNFPLYCNPMQRSEVWLVFTWLLPHPSTTLRGDPVTWRQLVTFLEVPWEEDRFWLKQVTVESDFFLFLPDTLWQYESFILEVSLWCLTEILNHLKWLSTLLFQSCPFFLPLISLVSRTDLPPHCGFYTPLPVCVDVRKGNQQLAVLKCSFSSGLQNFLKVTNSRSTQV